MSDGAIESWVPSPRHLLRVACIEHLTRDWEPGSVLEVGAGTGDVTSGFVDRGFSVTAHDLGQTSRAILRERFGDLLTVVDTLDEVEPVSVQHLFAFEVLEHVEDHLNVLKQWVRHLLPSGRVLISVPAHQRKFSDVDRAVGHVRRYERAELASLMSEAGLVDIEIANYGFPLGNLLRYAQSTARFFSGRHSAEASSEDDRIERTIDSGIQTSAPLNKMRAFLKPTVFRPFGMLQRPAFGRDWSDGYVATARRPE